MRIFRGQSPDLSPLIPAKAGTQGRSKVLFWLGAAALVLLSASFASAQTPKPLDTYSQDDLKRVEQARDAALQRLRALEKASKAAARESSEIDQDLLSAAADSIRSSVNKIAGNTNGVPLVGPTAIAGNPNSPLIKLVESWIKQLGLEKVLNKASTTWRELPEKEKAGVDEKKAVALLLAHPTLVKRPVLDRSGKLSLGFKPLAYKELFS